MKKKKVILILVRIAILIIIGIVSAFFIRLNKLKTIVEQDESGYGKEYLKLSESYAKYSDAPDRILYKSKEKDRFYIFENSDKNFEHLLEVCEDRMSYSLMEDYTGAQFKTVSLEKMMEAEDNYIIFDYTSEEKKLYNKPITYQLRDWNRLKRLLDYMCYMRRTYDYMDIGNIRGVTYDENIILSKENTNNLTNTQTSYTPVTTFEGYKKISTKEDLKTIINNIGGKYVLTNDIDMEGEEWFLRNNFTGVLDGNGFTLRNIRLENTNLNLYESFGLFGYDNTGIIRNIILKDIYINTKNVPYRVGGVVGVNKGTIENVSIEGTLTVGGQHAVGGIAATSMGGSFKNCTSTLRITADNASAAGIVVHSDNTEIINCSNSGNIKAASACGIVLSCNNKKIERCMNTGTIEGADIACGIMMYNEDGINECTNLGNVISNYTSAGICYSNNSTISNSTNRGNITGTRNVAGITNVNGDPNDLHGVIVSCLNTGAITINHDLQKPQYAGGIAGNFVLGSIKDSKSEITTITDTSKQIVWKNPYVGARSTKAISDIGDEFFGHVYDFQSYYDENHMMTLND